MLILHRGPWYGTLSRFLQYRFRSPRRVYRSPILPWLWTLSWTCPLRHAPPFSLTLLFSKPFPLLPNVFRPFLLSQCLLNAFLSRDALSLAPLFQVAPSATSASQPAFFVAALFLVAPVPSVPCLASLFPADLLVSPAALSESSLSLLALYRAALFAFSVFPAVLRQVPPFRTSAGIASM
jgi:hypothetical protein